MTYLAIFIFGAAVGAFIQVCWNDYIADTQDMRSLSRYERYRNATHEMRRRN